MLTIIYHIEGRALKDLLLLISGVLFVLWTLYKVEVYRLPTFH